jgi:hypothetical protein
MRLSSESLNPPTEYRRESRFPYPPVPSRLKGQKVARRAERIKIPAGDQPAFIEKLQRGAAPFSPRDVEAPRAES